MVSFLVMSIMDMLINYFSNISAQAMAGNITIKQIQLLSYAKLMWFYFSYRGLINLLESFIYVLATEAFSFPSPNFDQTALRRIFKLFLFRSWIKSINNIPKITEMIGVFYTVTCALFILTNRYDDKKRINVQAKKTLKLMYVYFKQFVNSIEGLHE